MAAAAGLTFTAGWTLAAGPGISQARGTVSSVQNGETVPIYSYANAIHETVYVPTSADLDGDDAPDRVAVDIIRPAEPAESGTKIPVIMEASPYYACCGRGNEEETKTYRSDGTAARFPLFYDNYFVPRGYAIAEVDLPGTARSTGCPDIGGPGEIAASTAVIDWFNGRRSGYDPTGGEVSATWSNGKVGMIGKSWDGSDANGVAATGVHGLRTVVAISAISSWYDYARFNGVLRSHRFVDSLDSIVAAHRHKCDDAFAVQQRASADASGNYNAFWRARDYRQHLDNVRASVFVVHGLNDQNVTPDQFAAWWAGLAAHHVARKLWLAQTGHVDPFDFRRENWVSTLHAWFDRWLYGVHNGVMAQPRVTVQGPSGQWTHESRWPHAATQSISMTSWGGGSTRVVHDRPKLSESAAVADPARHRAGRIVFRSPGLTRARHLSGSPRVALRMRVDRPTTEVTVRLVDYGRQRRVDFGSSQEGIKTLSTESCYGRSTAEDDACYRDTEQVFVTSAVDVIARGWMDAAHHLTSRHRHALQPGRWYSIGVPLSAIDTVVAAGHRIGVVVCLSDTVDTVPSTTGATATLDPHRSHLQLPTHGAVD